MQEKAEKLHQRPFMRYAKKEQVKEINQVNNGYKDIIVHPAFPYPSPYHDPDIWNDR
jgi:hypothetical protein